MKFEITRIRYFDNARGNGFYSYVQMKPKHLNISNVISLCENLFKFLNIDN